MKKKILALSLACAMIMSLAACSNNTPSGGNQNNNNNSSSNSAPSGSNDAAAATTWPEKAVNIIVPYAAGGDTDFNARTMAKYLSDALGVSVVVSNVTGSGGSIASNQVKDSANDGYTILCNHSSLSMNAASGIIDWDYTDLQMGCIFAKGQPETVIVRKDAPWNTIQELIDDSVAKPGTISMAASTGATTQWAAIALNNAGAQLNIVDAGGAADRIPALLGGHVDVITNNLATVRDYLDSGEFKALATCSHERSDAYPDVPTLEECGIECAYDMCYTFYFPGGTDLAIAQKLADTVKDIVDNNTNYAADIMDAYQQTPRCWSLTDSEDYYANELSMLMEISDVLRGQG